jgi:hypothetical protein
MIGRRLRDGSITASPTINTVGFGWRSLQKPLEEAPTQKRMSTTHHHDDTLQRFLRRETQSKRHLVDPCPLLKCCSDGVVIWMTAKGSLDYYGIAPFFIV